MMPYHLFARLVAALAMILFVAYGLATPVLLALYGIEPVPGADLMAKRAGCGFLAFGLIFYLLRDVEQPEIQRGLAQAVAIYMVIVAGTSLLGYLRGSAGSGILIAFIAELIFAALAIWVYRSGVGAKKTS